MLAVQNEEPTQSLNAKGLSIWHSKSESLPLFEVCVTCYHVLSLLSLSQVTEKMIRESAIGPSPLDTTGLCLLSLDGGGVRGLSSLLILRDIMTQLNSEREGGQLLKPCDVFDLMGGTSTGGYV
jgi:hypothetical protein